MEYKQNLYKNHRVKIMFMMKTIYDNFDENIKIPGSLIYILNKISLIVLYVYYMFVYFLGL